MVLVLTDTQWFNEVRSVTGQRMWAILQMQTNVQLKQPLLLGF